MSDGNGKSSNTGSPATAGSFGAAADSMANMSIGGYQGPNFFSGVANNAPGGAYTPPNQVAQTQQSQMQSQQAAPDPGQNFQPLSQRSFADQMNNSVQDYHLPGYGQPKVGPGQPLEQRSFADQINQLGPQPAQTPAPALELPLEQRSFADQINQYPQPFKSQIEPSFADQINQYPQPAVTPPVITPSPVITPPPAPVAAPKPAAKLPALAPRPAPKPAPRPVAKPSPFKTAPKPVARPAPFRPTLTRPGVQPALRTALKPPGR